MANESNRDREEISIFRISNEELQGYLKNNFNISIGTVTFTERDLQYTMSNDTYDVNIPNSSANESDNNSESSSSSGVKKPKTEFGADGKADIVTMLDPKFIVALSVMQGKDKHKAGGKENKNEATHGDISK